MKHMDWKANTLACHDPLLGPRSGRRAGQCGIILQTSTGRVSLLSKAIMAGFEEYEVFSGRQGIVSSVKG